MSISILYTVWKLLTNVVPPGGQPPSQTDASTAAPPLSPCEDTVSIFLQTASFLLDIHALKVCIFTHNHVCTYVLFY